MMKKFLRLSLILLLLYLCSAGLFSTYKFLISSYQKSIGVSTGDVASTKDWQDTVSEYVVSRNELINNILDGRCTDAKEAADRLKVLECAPLLNGDISMTDYMIKNPGQFKSRINNMQVEHCDIRQLSSEQTVIAAEISYAENGIMRKYDYDIEFKNIRGKWYLSKYTYAE